MKLKSIELFAGIGGFRLASDEVGIETVWANDIDENAAKVYKKNFKTGDFVLGNIQDVKNEVPGHDILTGGFPCQPFSSAGKKMGIRDPRGTLFQSIVDILKAHRPKYFVLENVKRLLSMESGQHFATILSSLSELGYLIEWRVLNAINFGLPQNRERVVMVGIRDGLSAKTHLLSDLDLNDLDENLLPDIDAPNLWKSISRHGSCFENWGVAVNDKFISCEINSFSDASPKKKLKDVMEKNVDISFDFTEGTKKRILGSERIDKYVNGVELIYNQGGGARMGYTIFGTSGNAPTLTSSTSRHYERYFVDGSFRRLTNVEYARLQGFPDGHCNGISVYDQYVLYGNAVPPPMVKWVLERVVNRRSTAVTKERQQMVLFQ